MCVIFVVPTGNSLTEEQLIDAFSANPDGMGFTDGRKVWKFLPKNQSDVLTAMSILKPDRPWIVHFRMRTHGPITLENVHPFAVPGPKNAFGIRRTMFFAHNGVFPDWSYGAQGDESDTRAWLREQQPTLLRAFKKVQSVRVPPNNRLAFFDCDGHVVTAGEGWSKIHGTEILQSNTYWRRRSTTYKNTWSHPYHGAYTYSYKDIYDKDDELYTSWLERSYTKPDKKKEDVLKEKQKTPVEFWLDLGGSVSNTPSMVGDVRDLSGNTLFLINERGVYVRGDHLIELLLVREDCTVQQVLNDIVNLPNTGREAVSPKRLADSGIPYEHVDVLHKLYRPVFNGPIYHIDPTGFALPIQVYLAMLNKNEPGKDCYEKARNAYYKQQKTTPRLGLVEHKK